MAVRGLQGTALVQIAERAGVAVGTLYNYFTDRDDLVRALFDHRRATLRPLLRAAGATAEGQPFDGRLRAFIHDVCAAVETHRRFVKIAIECEYTKVTPSTTPQDLLAAAQAVVDAGIEERTISPTYRALLPSIIVGALKAVMVRRLGEDAPILGDAELVASIILDGVRGRP